MVEKEEVKEKKKIFDLSFLQKIKDASSSKKVKLVLAGGLFIIVLLIFFSSFTSSTNSSKSSTSIEKQTQIVSYAEETETRLENILSKMQGISGVKVFVYVESSPEVVYLKETETITNSSSSDKTTTSIKETVVYDKNGNLSTAVVVVTKYPEIKGILIVAKGANDVKLKLKIIDAVSCVLSIAPTNIEVLEGKS